VTVDEIADRLYALPPDEFTGARDEAARELRREGLRAEATQVKELRRPTAAAAAVNQLVRKHRKDVERFLDAAAALRDAQVKGEGDLAKATKAERDALGKLVRMGGDQVRQSLQAAAIDREAASQLLAARLDRELELRGFGTLLGELPRASRQPARPPAPKKPDDSAARARLKRAKDDLADAQARERLARRELELARAAVERAQRQLTRLHGG
jgi:hypothetical protein